MSKPKNNSEVSQRISRYGWCRGFVHFWNKSGPVVFEDGCYIIKLQCGSCSTVRTTRVLISGVIFGNNHNYKHPHDYSLAGFEMNKGDIRRAFFQDSSFTKIKARKNQKQKIVSR